MVDLGLEASGEVSRKSEDDEGGERRIPADW